MATFLELRDKLRSKLKSADLICEGLSRSQKLYLLGGVFGILSVFWYLTPFHDIFLTGLTASGLFFIFGIISDLLAIYQAVWETTIGKGVLLLLYALCTNVAYAVASSLVNELVRFESSSLIYTINLFAILLAPIFIFLGTCAGLALLLALGQFYLMATTYSEQLHRSKFLSSLLPEPKERYPGATFAVRFVVFSVMLSLLGAYGSKVAPRYGAFIEKTAATFIFNVEATHYSRCEVDQTSRVIKVTDNEIVVVSHFRDGFRFEPKKCIPIIKP